MTLRRKHCVFTYGDTAACQQNYGFSAMGKYFVRTKKKTSATSTEEMT